MLTFQSVTELVDLLTAAGVPASVDPSDLNLPGAWVTVDSFRKGNVKGELQVTAAVYLIVPNVDAVRALEALADLFNLARTVVTPDGPVVSQGVLLPSAPTEPMPALRVPVHVPGHPTDHVPLSDLVMEFV